MSNFGIQTVLIQIRLLLEEEQWSESTLFCYRDVLNGFADNIADDIADDI